MRKTVKKNIKRYKFFFILLVVSFALMVYDFKLGMDSFRLTGVNMLEMLSILPPVFILLGLLDVWVDKALMIKLTGKGSGIKGAVIAFLLGSLAAGPLYAAFPIAGVMLQKRKQVLECDNFYRCVVNNKSTYAYVRSVINGTQVHAVKVPS